MRIRRTLSALVAAGVAAGAGLALAPAATAAPTGTSSLAALLASDGDTFDRNWRDFDILDQAVGAVLAAKPASPVAVLADGTVPLTAFVPNDRAFQLLAKDLTHRWYGSEQEVLTALAGAVGIDAIEQVLLYHVVPGATIDSGAALASDNVALTTAQGGTFTVDVLSKRWGDRAAARPGPQRPQPVPDPRPAGPERGQRPDRARDHLRPAPRGPLSIPTVRSCQDLRMLHDLTLEGHGARLVPLADEHAEPLSAFVDDRALGGDVVPDPGHPGGRCAPRSARRTRRPGGSRSPCWTPRPERSAARRRSTTGTHGSGASRSATRTTTRAGGARRTTPRASC